MKFSNNARNGMLISMAIAIIILLIIVIVNSIPNVDVSTLSETSKLKYNFGVSKGEIPLWKIVCYIIIGVLFVLYVMVNFIMCRCPYCGRYINHMNIFMMYCPYCSKRLDKTNEEK